MQTESVVYHQIQLQTPTPLLEVADQAEDATVYYSMAMVSATSIVLLL